MKIWLRFLIAHKKKLLLVAVFFVFVVSAISSQRILSLFDKKTAARVAQKNAEQVISDVAKIYDLPTDEEPTLATVSDTKKLADQPFFAKAQQDDRVLFFPKSKKAILYRPSTNKIIEVSSLSLPNATE